MDLLLELAEDGSGCDLVVADGDLVLGHALRGAVLSSLFCDARREDPKPAALTDALGDPRGWWADTPSDRFGSTLWLHSKGKVRQADLSAIEEDVRHALQWVLDDGVATTLEVAAVRQGQDRVVVTATLTRAATLRWQELWQGEEQVDLEWVTLRLLTR